MLRILTGLALVVAFMAGLYDGAQTLAQGQPVATSLGEAWYSLHVASLNLLQVVLERYLWPPLWNPGVVTVLQYPVWLVFGALAVGLGIIGRIARM